MSLNIALLALPNLKKEEFFMKNLKRVLSLALTGTMLAGMMTIGASAANKDFTGYRR